MTYRNVWTQATFRVNGDDAIARMDALPSWKRVKR